MTHQHPGAHGEKCKGRGLGLCPPGVCLASGTPLVVALSRGAEGKSRTGFAFAYPTGRFLTSTGTPLPLPKAGQREGTACSSLEADGEEGAYLVPKRSTVPWQQHREGGRSDWNLTCPPGVGRQVGGRVPFPNAPNGTEGRSHCLLFCTSWCWHTGEGAFPSLSLGIGQRGGIRASPVLPGRCTGDGW